MNILHIAVHLGGGVGTVVKNWIKNDPINNHKVLLLNKNYYGEDPSYIHNNMRNKNDEIKEYIKKSDIIVIHFWNHPLLFEFLVNFKFPPCRLCIWSHVSGLNPPYVHLEKLANLSDKFILSSPISFSGGIDSFSDKSIGKTSVIWTTGGVEDYLKINKRVNKDFVVGYIGTLDYCKISPNFVPLCEEILKEIPDAKFVICGVGPDEEKIKKEISHKGLGNSFSFKGMCLNVKEIIPSFSVLGYPLNEKHFGTCEQVLGEVMAAGIMPVVFDNPAEKHICQSIGKVSKCLEEYIKNIIDLYSKPINRKVALDLKGRAKELYDMNTMIDSWNKVFSECLVSKKESREWNASKVYNGYEIFLESIGKYSNIVKSGNLEEIKRFFSSDQWLSKSKGSIRQYVDAFPNDSRLLNLLNIIND